MYCPVADIALIPCSLISDAKGGELDTNEL